MGERHAGREENLTVWRERLVRGVLYLLVAVGSVVVVRGAYRTVVEGRFLWAVLYAAIYGGLAFVTFRRRVRYTVRAVVLLVLLYGFAVISFVKGGLGGDGRIPLMALPALAMVLFGRREGIVALVVGGVTMLVFSVLFANGILVIPIVEQADTASGSAWLGRMFVVVAIGGLLLFSQAFILSQFQALINRQARTIQRLEARNAILEKRVAERTAELERRSAQLAAAARVAREAAAIRDVEQLMSRTVNLIAERFGYYHVAIYLLDPTVEALVMRAASSQGGRELVAQGYRVRLDETTIVGRVAREGEFYLAADVSKDAVYRELDGLSETRAEIAVPLRSHERVIGVLDVQSRRAGAFSREDAVVLRSLADQIALVIGNAQLFQQLRETLEAEQRMFRRLGREAWEELMASDVQVGFLRNDRGVASAALMRPRMMEALRQGRAVRDGDAVAVPIKVRGNVVGVVDARKPVGSGAWTGRQLDLLQTLVTQLQLALESAQLYHDSRSRALREQLTREVTDRMRRVATMEALIKVTLEEVASVLKASGAFIQLRSPAEWRQATADGEVEG